MSLDSMLQKDLKSILPEVSVEGILDNGTKIDIAYKGVFDSEKGFLYYIYESLITIDIQSTIIINNESYKVISVKSTRTQSFDIELRKVKNEI